MEVWKDVPGYAGKYQVSSSGRVKSLPRNDVFCKRSHEVILKPFLCGSGYEEVILSTNGKKCPKLIHRLVAEVFVPNSRGKREVNHKDGNKTNNDFNNLEWITPSENVQHSYNSLHHKAFSRRVLCVETGEEFESIKDAADKYKLQLPLVWKCCNGKQKTTGGYHWRYADTGETMMIV